MSPVLGTGPEVGAPLLRGTAGGHRDHHHRGPCHLPHLPDEFHRGLGGKPMGTPSPQRPPHCVPKPIPHVPAPSPLCPRASPSVSPWPPMSPCPPHHVPVSSAVSSYPLCHVPTLVPPCPCALPCPTHQVPVSSPSPHPPSGVPMLVPHVPMLSQPCPLCVLRSCSNTTPT